MSHLCPAVTALLLAAGTLTTLPAHAQRSPMSWELLDHSRPIYLAPWALVCRTIQQAERAGMTEDETGPGCAKPRRA